MGSHQTVWAEREEKILYPHGLTYNQFELVSWIGCLLLAPFMGFSHARRNLTPVTFQVDLRLMTHSSVSFKRPVIEGLAQFLWLAL